VLTLTPQGRGKADACCAALRGPVEETAEWLSPQDAATVARFLRHLATMRELRSRADAEAGRSRRAPPAVM
jgi:hypothetical protein